MLGSVSTFKSSDHSIIGGDINEYVKRMAKRADRDLFVIRYERLGVFCICEWVSPNRDVFIDIMNLGKSLANFDREKADEFQRRLFKPITCDETSKWLSETQSDYHHERQDWNEEEHERLARCARGE